MVAARSNYRASDMHGLEIRLSPGDLSRQMAAMRMWLDEHRVDLSTFSCSYEGDGTLVRVEFRLAHQATAFAECFGGRASRPLVASAQEDLMQEMSAADALVG
jgi:hypothetical protein